MTTRDDAGRVDAYAALAFLGGDSEDETRDTKNDILDAVWPIIAAQARRDTLNEAIAIAKRHKAYFLEQFDWEIRELEQLRDN